MERSFLDSKTLLPLQLESILKKMVVIATNVSIFKASFLLATRVRALVK